MLQSVQQIEKPITRTLKLQYLLYLPKEYKETGKEKWPLVLFLHGAGERGNDIEKVKVHAIPKLAEAGGEFPFICLAPQCPAGLHWGIIAEELCAMLQDVISEYPVDTSRVYCTGLSMGGYGTWTLAMEHPNAFAAIAPICGGSENAEEGLPRITQIPIWAFHGAKDSVVPFEETAELVRKLNDLGGQVRFTAYHDLDHDCWTTTYENPKLFEWMLAQRNESFSL